MVPIITRVLIDHVCAAGMRQTVAGTWLGRGACWLRTSQRAGMETANLTHPVSRQLHSFFQTVSILVSQITNRLGDVNPLLLGSQDLRVLILHQTWVGAGHLQHYVGKLFDAVRMAAADVVSLTGLEVANDIRQCRDGVRQISGCP